MPTAASTGGLSAPTPYYRDGARVSATRAAEPRRVRVSRATRSDYYEEYTVTRRRYSRHPGVERRHYGKRRGVRTRHARRHRAVTHRRHVSRRLAAQRRARAARLAQRRKAARARIARPRGRGHQHGVASFYSSPQRVASGGWFNPNAMTAAHRSLPFGSRVRVTHLGNGRSVEVRINDRGPFIAGRVIDLSRAAARVLGIGGLARVKLEVLGR
jgi:rare lipoprotein A